MPSVTAPTPRARPATYTNPMTPLGRCASGRVTERKKPSGIRIGAATNAIRTIHFHGSPRSVWSTHSSATRANTSHTPAWA